MARTRPSSLRGSGTGRRGTTGMLPRTRWRLSRRSTKLESPERLGTTQRGPSSWNILCCFVTAKIKRGRTKIPKFLFIYFIRRLWYAGWRVRKPLRRKRRLRSWTRAFTWSKHQERWSRTPHSLFRRNKSAYPSLCSSKKRTSSYGSSHSPPCWFWQILDKLEVVYVAAEIKKLDVYCWFTKIYFFLTCFISCWMTHSFWMRMSLP